MKTFVKKSAQKTILPSHKAVTLKEGQGDSSWYQNVEFSAVYDHPKFKRNQFVNVQAQTNIKGGFFSSSNHISRALYLESWTTERTT